MLKIITLESNHEEYIKQVVQWLHEEWGNKDNLKFFESLVRNSLNQNDIPATFAALWEGNLAGTVSLWRNDLKCRQDLCPWLAALYVDKDYRNKGIGTAVQCYILEWAKGKGYDSVYLFTELMEYYEKNGWTFMGEEVTFQGEQVRLYGKQL